MAVYKEWNKDEDREGTGFKKETTQINLNFPQVWRSLCGVGKEFYNHIRVCQSFLQALLWKSSFL